MIPGKHYSTEVVLRLAWRRRWLIVLPFLIGSLGAAVYAGRVPDRYRSDALILVVPQRVPETYVRSTVTMRIDQRLPAITQQIMSRTRLEAIVLELNLYEAERRAMLMEDVIARMRRDIDVRMMSGDAFRVSFISDTPRTAMLVADRLASQFNEENLKDREGLSKATTDFLQVELEDARRRLVEHEERLAAYKRKHAGQLPSETQSNLQVLQNLQARSQALADSIGRDRDRRLFLERQIADLTDEIARVDRERAAGDEGPEAVEDPARVTAELEAARNALRSASLRLTAEHPEIIRMKRAVSALESKLEQMSAAPAPGAARLRTDVTPRRARLADLQGQLDQLDLQLAAKSEEEQVLVQETARYKARVEAAPTRETELIALTRDYETLKALHAGLLGKREESKVAANLEKRQIGEQFRLLDRPQMPQRPFSPNRPMMALVGATLGLGVGVGLILLLEYRDRSLRNEQDAAECLALPVLATIPVLRTERERRWLAIRRWAVSASVLAVAAATVVAWVLLV